MFEARVTTLEGSYLRVVVCDKVDKVIKSQREIFINYLLIREQSVPCNVCITAR